MWLTCWHAGTRKIVGFINGKVPGSGEATVSIPYRLLLHFHDPDHFTRKRALIIDCMIAAGWYGDATAGSGYEQSKGGSNVVDDIYGTGNFVALGVGEWPYDG